MAGWARKKGSEARMLVYSSCSKRILFLCCLSCEERKKELGERARRERARLEVRVGGKKGYFQDGIWAHRRSTAETR